MSRSLPALAPRAFALIASLPFLLAAAPAPPATRFVDYLYLEPNEGGASAGHVALGFADRTYHFERLPGGLLQLERDDPAHFRYLYAALGNRAIHVTRIAVSDETRALLEAGFNTRYLIERRALAIRASLETDRRLLDVFLRRARAATGGASGSRAGSAERWSREDDQATDSLAIEGAGFFFPEERSGERSPAVAALEALQDAPGLRADASFAPATGDAAIEPRERSVLAAYSRTLGDELVRLAAAERPGWGYSFLVGMARLAAIELSLESGHWVFLDATPPDHARIDHRVVARAADADPTFLDELLGEARADFAAARADLIAQPKIGEREYARVEMAGDRFCELERALETRGDVRIHDGAYLPSCPAARSALVVPRLSADRLVQVRAAVAGAQRAYERELVRLYGYDLLAHNCVTELFRTVDPSLAPPADGGLTFVPLLSQSAVRRAYQVEATGEIPSYRSERLAELDRLESPLVVALRESNTLTSTVYRRSRDDSYFLFFTDGAPAARPVLGTANLAVGIGAGVAGLALLPVDGGETVVAGLKGAVFSLPELVFVNIRKGSFDHVDHRHRPAPPTLAAP